MATLKEAAARLDVLSAQISTQARTISLGVLAVTWLFLSGSKDSPSLLGKVPQGWLLSIAEVALFALLLDMVQYFVQYERIRRRRDAALKAQAKEMTYPSDWMRDFFFYGKLLLAFVSALMLIGASAKALLS